jgi:hypothetical protein
VNDSARASVGLLLALLAGCGPSAERAAADRQAIESLLADYSARMIRAYETGDTGPLAEVATGREITRVGVRIREMSEQGRALRPRLVRLVVESVEASSATGATTTTIESWDLTLVALGSELTIAESKGQENRVVYSLLRERGRWWVLSRMLRSSTEAP